MGICLIPAKVAADKASGKLSPLARMSESLDKCLARRMDVS